MATLENSYIYKSFNASNAFIDKFVKFIKSGVALDRSYIEEQYSQINKVAFSPLTKKVLAAFDSGEIELLYSKTVKIGISFPFIIRRRSDGKIIATIFISSFTNLNSDDNAIPIPVKQLYALMESAYIALKIQQNPMGVQKDTTLMKICTSIYKDMMMRILNKEYALTIDKSLEEKVSYIIIRFFLEKVWEYPNTSLIHSYASYQFQNLEAGDLDLLKLSYDNAQVTDFNSMITFLKTVSPRLKDINTRYMIERYVNTYHGSSILAIDYLPYTFFVIINVLLGSFLISQVSLNDIIKSTKGINSFYPELSKIV